MKHDKMKRVLAATLSLLTVAGPMTANVGGIIKDVAIVASAATSVSVSWEDEIGQYITSITDGTTTVDNAYTKESTNKKLLENSILTIVSSVPLSFTKTGYLNPGDISKVPDDQAAATDLAAKNGAGAYTNENKYIETVSSSGVYTYKILNNKLLTIHGVNVNVDFEYTAGANLTLGDGTKVTTVAVANYYVGTPDTPLTADTTSACLKKGKKKIYSDKAFEVYVYVNATDAIVKYAAVYDTESGKFLAEPVIPDGTPTAGSNIKVYLNKVTPVYTFTNTGTQVLASATNAPQVTAASVKATFEAKVKMNKDELAAYNAAQRAADPTWVDVASAYKYDTSANLSTGATVPNDSRVVLSFTNDVTDEITTKSADATPVYFKLKITKDGQELTDAATPFVSAVDGAAYPALADATTYGTAGIKDSATKHVPGAAAATDNATKLAFTATGKYKVEYTVFTKTTSANGQVSLTPQTMTYEFTIATKDLLTPSNVRLTATGANLLGSPIKKVAIVNGVVQFEVTDAWLTSKDTITVTPTLFADADEAADIANHAASTFAGGAAAPNAANGTPKAITGTTQNNELNTVNQMTIIYNNSDYSAVDQSVTVQWKLVEQKKAVQISYNELNGYGPGLWATRNDAAIPYFITTIDQLENIKQDLLKSIQITNGDATKIDFEYVEDFGHDANSEELDDHISGLPDKAGKYSVYILYEGEIVEALNVQLDEHALYASLSDAQASYTYGVKKPKTEDLTFVDVEGNAVKDAGVKYAGIEYKKALKLSAVQARKITAEGKITLPAGTVVDNQNIGVNAYDDVDVYTIGSDKYIEYVGDATDYDVNYIPAGNYIVSIGAKAGETEIAKKGYSLQAKKFTVTVAKKTLTPDMVTITPKNYTGGSVYPTAGDLTVYDKDIKANVAGCTYAGGTTSGSAVGTYTIGVQAPANSNYTGKVNGSWSIVKAANNEKMNGLNFVAGQTTIKDNGRIHVEITRPADSQFSNGVAQFGVIYDKKGTLKAPTKNAGAGSVNYPAGKYPRTGNNAQPDTTNHTLTYTNEVTNGFAAKAEFEDAAKKLQLGNGFDVGEQDPALVSDKTKYGANISVVDVETGCWFRPYVVDGQGNIYYGEVCYVNLVQEATDALQLKMAAYNAATPKGVVTKAEAKKDQSATVLANKTWRNDVKSGYSEKDGKYYVYGSYTLEGNELVKESAVQGFGVVVDKKGAFTVDGVLASDNTTTVADGLKLGKGYIEGKAGSDKMDADEYGAMITPVNSVTGVWVRAYVDLGKGKGLDQNLIVYTQPVYIKDVSSIYNGSVGIAAMVGAVANDATAKDVLTTPGYKNKAIFATDTGKQRVNVNSLAIANATLKQSGVIVDKSGSFLLKYTAGGKIGEYVTGNEAANTANLGSHNAAVVAGFTAENLAAAEAKMILGNGYLQGKKAVDINGNYTVTFSQDKYRATAGAAESNIPAVIRPFSIYEIAGKEIVVYGAPIVTTENG